ncbi:MAG: Holliday junction resolvase-like protein [Thermoplasmatota archaeon]
MDPWIVLVAALALLLAASWLLAWRGRRRWTARLREARSAHQSTATRHGQIAEQFVPLSAAWPWDPKRFRFLGDPIDGIQFTDDGVVLVEIKTAGSRLSAMQRQVRDHVQAGRVTWQEVRLR